MPVNSAQFLRSAPLTSAMPMKAPKPPPSTAVPTKQPAHAQAMMQQASPGAFSAAFQPSFNSNQQGMTGAAGMPVDQNYNNYNQFSGFGAAGLPIKQNANYGQSYGQTPSQGQAAFTPQAPQYGNYPIQTPATRGTYTR